MVSAVHKGLCPVDIRGGKLWASIPLRLLRVSVEDVIRKAHKRKQFGNSVLIYINQSSSPNYSCCLGARPRSKAWEAVWVPAPREQGDTRHSPAAWSGEVVTLVMLLMLSFMWIYVV